MMTLFNKDNFMLGTFTDFKKCKRRKLIRFRIRFGIEILVRR